MRERKRERERKRRCERNTRTIILREAENANNKPSSKRSI